MTVADVLRAVRARWPLFLLCCLVPVAAALAISGTSKPAYASTAELFVAAPGAANTPDAYQGALFAQQQAPSYAELATSPAVMSAVVADLRLATSPADLARQVSAVSPTNSVLIDVTAQASSAAAARSIANAAALQLATTAEHLSEPKLITRPQVKLTLVKPAVLSATLSSKRKTDLILGLIVGLAVAFSAVILREKADGRLRTVQQAQTAAGCRLVTEVAGPHQRAGAKTRIGTPAAESFRRLCVQLAPLMAASRTRSLAVTSLVPGDPGPAVAANVALALAEGGAIVALVDVDPRSGLARYFGVDGSVGVTAIIDGVKPLRAAAQRYNERLFILPTGAAPPSWRHVASLAQLTELVGLLGREADQVVVHVGPVLADARGAELCAAAQTVVLAARMGKDRQAELRLAAEILGSANVGLGAVVLANERLAPMTSAFQTAGPVPAGLPSASTNGAGPVTPGRGAPYHARPTTVVRDQ
jgi:capsular polysaccharide biosynthesis protein